MFQPPDAESVPEKPFLYGFSRKSLTIMRITGGQARGIPLALPKGVNAAGSLTWIAFDPVHELLYAMQMASDLYQMKVER